MEPLEGVEIPVVDRGLGEGGWVSEVRDRVAREGRSVLTWRGQVEVGSLATGVELERQPILDRRQLSPGALEGCD